MEDTEIFSIQELAARLGGPIDYYVCSASYEDRSVHLASNLSGVQIKHVVVASNSNHSYNSANRSRLRELFTSQQYEEIKLHSEDPIGNADRLSDFIKSAALHNCRHIVIDVSAFTRETLAVILRILCSECRTRGNVQLIYNPAKSYDRSGIGLSRGLKSIRSILGYSGFNIPSRDNHLIILPGLEFERASDVIASLEPNLTSIGVVKTGESFAGDFAKLQEQFVRRLIDTYAHKAIETFEFSARSPLFTKNAILKRAEKSATDNTIVLPMNSKPSVVGACLACLSNSNLQLGYAQPLLYHTTAYSEASDIVTRIVPNFERG